MEFTTENLERAVSQFYHTDAQMQAQAHQWLTSAQTSPNAWSFVWELLQPCKSSEVQFFAATTLHMKVMKNWSEVPVEQYEDLKKRLLQVIVNYATGPKIVLNRLCIALSAFILHTTPGYWPGAIPELLATFQQSNIPSVPPDKALWILLEVLTVIPEEFQSMHMSQNQKMNARLELERNTPKVVGLVESVLSAVSKDWLLVSQAVRCASAWLQLGVPVTECAALTHHLVQAVTLAPSNTQLVEGVVEALSLLGNHPTTHKYPSAVLGFINRVLPVYELALQHPDNQDLLSSVYGLFVSLGESHTRLILHSLLTDASASCLQLVNIVLACSNTPGHYPVHESYSHLGFGFWYILQDELVACEPGKHQALLPTIVPVYSSLALVLIHKAQFPPDDLSVSAEDKEAFRCYRQDIADTMMYCYNVLREPLLGLLLDRLKDCLTSNSAWQPLEACLHGLLSVAESVAMTENRHLPQLCETLPVIDYGKLNTRVSVTALDVIGAYAEWLNNHPDALPRVIPLLLYGLQNPETAAAASMSLKDITRECQLALEPYAHHILTGAMEVLQGGKLKENESVRLMYSVGRVLSILPLQTIIQYLDTVMLPCVDELRLLLNEPVSAEVKAALLLRLKMLSMMCNSLDTQAASEREREQEPPVATEQPVYLVLERVLPTLTGIVSKWQQHACVIQAVCCVLKHAIGTLVECCSTLVPAITELIATSYRLHPHAAPFEVVRQLCLLFGREGCPHQPLVQSLLTLVVRRTLELPAAEHTDIAEAAMQLCSALVKKNSPLLTSAEDIDITELVSFAILVLGLPELPTVKAAAVFLTAVVTVSREQPRLLTTVQTTGELLVQRILRSVGGESPRGCIDPLADVLLALNKKYCDSLSRWLYQLTAVDGFPSPLASPDHKLQFVKMVLKERANKRRLQEELREFTLVCRGLVGTEYAAQLKANLL